MALERMKALSPAVVYPGTLWGARIFSARLTDGGREAGIAPLSEGIGIGTAAAAGAEILELTSSSREETDDEVPGWTEVGTELDATVATAVGVTTVSDFGFPFFLLELRFRSSVFVRFLLGDTLGTKDALGAGCCLVSSFASLRAREGGLTGSLIRLRPSDGSEIGVPARCAFCASFFRGDGSRFTVAGVFPSGLDRFLVWLLPPRPTLPPPNLVLLAGTAADGDDESSGGAVLRLRLGRTPLTSSKANRSSPCSIPGALWGASFRRRRLATSVSLLPSRFHSWTAATGASALGGSVVASDSSSLPSLA